MYIKICCFKMDSDTPRYVNAVFDGEEVLPKSEVISKDESAPDEFIIQINKTPGIYKMTVDVPDHSFEDDGTVVLSDLFVSSDGETDWKDYKINGLNSDSTTLIDPSVRDNMRVKNVKHLWNFWYGDDLVLNIEIPEDLNARFLYHSAAELIAAIQSEIDSLPSGSDRRIRLETLAAENIPKLSVLV